MTTCNPPKCPGPECTKPVKAAGLCGGHYMQQKRGKPLVPLMVKGANDGKLCRTPGCRRASRSLGLCGTHYSGHLRAKHPGRRRRTKPAATPHVQAPPTPQPPRSPVMPRPTVWRGSCPARCAATGRRCNLPAHAGPRHVHGRTVFFAVAAEGQAVFSRTAALDAWATRRDYSEEVSP